MVNITCTRILDFYLARGLNQTLGRGAPFSSKVLIILLSFYPTSLEPEWDLAECLELGRWPQGRIPKEECGSQGMEMKKCTVHPQIEAGMDEELISVGP